MQLDSTDSEEVTAITFYDDSNGKIITSFFGNLEVFDFTPYSQYKSLPIVSSPLTQYIDGGQAVDMPAKPTPDSVFNYSTKQWENPSIQKGWEVVRNMRAIELAKSDWTQFPDVQLPNKQQWIEYRQALRDVTLQPDPFNIVWPVPPQD